MGKRSPRDGLRMQDRRHQHLLNVSVSPATFAKKNVALLTKAVNRARGRVRKTDPGVSKRTGAWTNGRVLQPLALTGPEIGAMRHSAEWNSDRDVGKNELMLMADFWFWLVGGFVAGVVFASFFEWAWHRYVMHRPIPGFRYPFQAHALTHHRIFRADETYHLQDPEDRHTVPMAWWNGPALIAICEIPFLLVSWYTGIWALAGGAVVAFGTYYVAYEYMHYCMHVPRRRKLERTGLFFRLNGHHLLHHRYMDRHLNVVLPLADLCCGTLLRRSKIRFAQARGLAVPDVQPTQYATSTERLNFR